MLCRFIVSLLLFVQLSYADNRVDMCDIVVTKLGVTFYTSAELQTIAKCAEPQMYATPNNTTAIATSVKNCVINNSGNKAVTALSLYTNANTCLNPESLSDVVTTLIPPIQKLAAAFVKELKSTLATCKKNNTKTGAAKQEACIQKCYGVAKAAVTLTYVDNICKKVVNQNVTNQEWGCGLKYIPSVLDTTKYGCFTIVKS
ncbi:unnamed protein product [Caenorhabditis sp. 36 PRJEB53466]|nr:unnamed protein product [Caenorhabditis sp. 36 PRJEB53466]